MLYNWLCCIVANIHLHSITVSITTSDSGGCVSYHLAIIHTIQSVADRGFPRWCSSYNLANVSPNNCIERRTILLRWEVGDTPCLLHLSPPPPMKIIFLWIQWIHLRSMNIGMSLGILSVVCQSVFQWLRCLIVTWEISRFSFVHWIQSKSLTNSSNNSNHNFLVLYINLFNKIN